jgi:hypothetical protein
MVNILKHIVNLNFFIFEKYVNLYKEQEEKYKKEILRDLSKAVHFRYLHRLLRH